MATKRRATRKCPKCSRRMNHLILLNAHYCRACKRMFYPGDTKGIPAPSG